METERFLFDTPKTCFNSVTGKKIADNVVAMSVFATQESYCFLKDDTDVLLDAKGQKIADRLNLIDVDHSRYIVDNDDDTMSLWTSDGRVLFDKMQNIVFSPNGWFVVVDKNGVKALYRPDLTLAAKEFLQASVMGSGECFFAEYEPKNWTAYYADGTVLAQNVKEFQFLSPTFYILTFQDKTVVYDDEKHTKFVCEASLPQLLFGHKLKAVSNGNLLLYRSDGFLLWGGHKDYLSFDNGLGFAKRDDDTCFVFNAQLDIVVDNVTDFDGGLHGEFLLVSTEDKDYLFDNNGHLLREADDIQLCGQNCFLLKNGKNNVGVLYAEDGSVLDKGVIDAVVFDDGWFLMEKAPIMPHHESYFELRDNDGVFVTTSPFVIEYFGDYKAWMVQKDDHKFVLYHDDYGVVLDDVDKMVSVGAFILTRKGDVVDVFSLAEFNERKTKGVEQHENVLTSLWHGSIHDVANDVCFCGGDCIGNMADFSDIFDEQGKNQLHIGIGVVIEKNDGDADDENHSEEDKA